MITAQRLIREGPQRHARVPRGSGGCMRQRNSASRAAHNRDRPSRADGWGCGCASVRSSRFGAVRRAAYGIVSRHRVKSQSTYVVSHSVPSSISSSCIAVRRRCGARADTHGLHEEESEWSGACEYGWQIQPCRSAAHHTPGRQYARISAHRGGPRVGRLAACDTAPASGTVCCSLPPALPRLPTYCE